MAVNKVNDIHMAATINEMDDTTTNLILFSIYSSCLIVGNCKHCRKATCILANTCPCTKRWCLFFMFDPKTHSLMLCCACIPTKAHKTKHGGNGFASCPTNWCKKRSSRSDSTNSRTAPSNTACSQIRFKYCRRHQIHCQHQTYTWYRERLVFREMVGCVAGNLECSQRWLPFYLHLLVS